jgi:uncharacterized protein (DUF2141 family)
MSLQSYALASAAFSLLAPVSAAATANATGAGVSLIASDYEGSIEITQSVGAVTGSITGQIEDSADGSTGWAALTDAAFTVVSAANNVQRIRIGAQATRGWIRYVGTIVTGPAVVSVTASGIRKSR